MVVLGIMVYFLAGAAIITSLYFIIDAVFVKGPKYRIIIDDDEKHVAQKRNIFMVWVNLPLGDLGNSQFDSYTEAAQALKKYKEGKKRKGSNVVATADDDDSDIVMKNTKGRKTLR